MKRIKLKAVVKDELSKSDWRMFIHPFGELESYDEHSVGGEKVLEEEYSFDRLLEALSDFANGAWMVIKSLGVMAKWSAVLIFHGFRWLWTRGAGKKKEEVLNGKEKNG